MPIPGRTGEIEIALLNEEGIFGLKVHVRCCGWVWDPDAQDWCALVTWAQKVK